MPAPAPALVTRTPAPTASKAVEKDRSSKGKERESQDKHRRRHHRSSSRSRDRRHRKDDAGRDRDRGKTDDEHRRRHRDGSRERSHRHRNANEVSHRRRKTRSPSPKKSSSLIPRASAPRSPTPESWDAPKKQYYVDTKGDDNNLVYGTIHRYSIPDYRRGGSGSIVGLPPNVKIDKEKGDGKGLVLSTGGRGKEGSSMKAMRQAFSRLASKDTKRLRVRKEETGLEEAFSRGVDFVPLSITTKKRKSRSDGSDESDDNYEDHYRSILGLKKSSEAPADKDLEYASESQSEGDYIATEEWGDRKRMVELVRKVDAEPKNIDAWMAYVNHHDNMVSATGRRKTAAEKRSIAEVKLDILQKGLEKNPGNERLLLRHMEVAEEIWDSKKLLEKWKSILKDNPAIVSLWTKYINFRQTDFLSFTYPECLKCFSESLLVLRSAAFKTDTRSPTREALDEVILYVFTRTILLMDEAGYKENAIAALQAMLELNLFAPPNILPPSSIREFETIIEHVEKFWDSEVPRIGEENALGWAAFVTSGEEGNPPDPVEEELQLPPLDPKNPFGSWTNAEVEWSRKIGMPARTIDEVEEDDPYRVILFSDLKDFMFYFSSERIRKKMVEAFLVLKNLPPLTPHSSNGAIMEDMFLRSGLSKLGEDDLESWFWPKTQGQSDALAITWEGMEPEKKAAMGNPFEYKLRNFPVGCENVFSKSAGWFDGIEPLKLNRKEATGFVRNTLKTLVESVEDESLALYYLAWEWAQVKAQNKYVRSSSLA